MSKRRAGGFITSIKFACTGYSNTCPPFTLQVKFGDLALLNAGILATNNSDVLASLVKQVKSVFWPLPD